MYSRVGCSLQGTKKHCMKGLHVLQDTGFRPSATPTTMSSLPNQHIMFGSETGDGCTVKMPGAPKGGEVGRGGRGSSGGPMMPAATVSLVLQNAAPVWAFTVANLQQLPQDQVLSHDCVWGTWPVIIILFLLLIQMKIIIMSILIIIIFINFVLPSQATLVHLCCHQQCIEWQNSVCCVLLPAF